jgi:hypothetical protein
MRSMTVQQTTEARPSRVPPKSLGLRPGEMVRVRSALEIGPTLDPNGALDGMPFMPEMLQYCGRTYRVSHRADKTCAGDGEVRRMHDAVHLADLRCDGSGHGGCQAACLLFWKEAWLERVETDAVPTPEPAPNGDHSRLRRVLDEAARAETDPIRYRCQATEIPSSSRPLRYREVDQYVRDVRNWGLAKVLRGLVVQAFNLWQSFSGRHLPRWLRIAGGRSYPFLSGAHPVAKGATPKATLDLQPGELVRIKSKSEIESTLDRALHNRGLGFDPEMTIYCGRTARVRARVNRIVDEHTGEMIEIKSDCIMLDRVVCKADYHLFCPRQIHPYWREIWLERVEPEDSSAGRPTDAGAESSCG